MEHIIRAAGTIADTADLVIIGSQSILGSFSDPPAELTVSEKADTYPLHAPAKADLIDGSIGEKSPFHETFGYYAHGVGPETAVLPARWQARLIPLRNDNTRGVTGWCLSPVDLAVSKLAAGRAKDFVFVTAMLRHRLVAPGEVAAAIGELEPGRQAMVSQRFQRCRSEAEA